MRVALSEEVGAPRGGALGVRAMDWANDPDHLHAEHVGADRAQPSQGPQLLDRETCLNSRAVREPASCAASCTARSSGSPVPGRA